MMKRNVASVVLATYLLGGLGITSNTFAEDIKIIKPDTADIAVAAVETVDAPRLDGGMNREGINLAQLKAIVPDVRVLFSDNSVKFSGLVPAECAAGAHADYVYDEKAAAHVIVMRLNPVCEKIGYRPAANTPRVRMSAAIAPVVVEDKSGKFVLRAFKGGDITDLLDPAGQDNSDLPLTAMLSSVDAKEKEKQDKIRREQEQVDARRRSVLNQAIAACKSGDYEKVSNLLRDSESSGLIQDVETILSNLDKAQRDLAKSKIAKAKDSDEAKDIYDKMIELAISKNWDRDPIDKAYIKKRMDIIAKAVENNSDLDSSDDEDGKVKTSKKSKSLAEAEIDDFSKELAALDSGEFRANKRKLAESLGTLATAANDEGKFDESVRLWTKARKLVGNDDRLKIDDEISNVYVRAFEACVKKDARKVEACEKKFAEKARKKSEQVADKFAQKAASGNEAAMSEYEEYMQKYAGLFGSGPQYYWTGYGRSTPMAPGAVEQVKQQGIQDLQQRMMQQYQQRMMGQGYAGGMNQGMSPQMGMSGNFGLRGM